VPFLSAILKLTMGYQRRPFHNKLWSWPDPDTPMHHVWSV